MEKERRTKALLLSTLVVVVATLSIAFASLSRTLSINGIGKMDTASWSVYFDNLSEATTVRGAQEIGKPKISDDKGTVQDINVKLSNPKDEISYTVDIVNAGTIDAEITIIKDIELTDAQKKVFEFKVTYTDTGEVLKDGDLLPKDTTKNITINIKFKDDITEFDLPTESQTINLSYQITYTQYDGSEIVIEPDSGDITTGKSVLATTAMADLMASGDPSSEPFFNGALPRNQVKSVTFLRNKNVSIGAESTVWDASESGDNSVIGWYENSETDGLYNVYIGSDNQITVNDCSVLFAVFLNLEEVNFNGNLDTSNAISMNSMFSMDSALKNIDIASIKTQNSTDMSSMFYLCASLTSLNLSHFYTTKVTNMFSMFGDCEKLTSLDVSSFDTSNVTMMGGMFYNCSSLTSLDLSSFDTSKVTDISGIIYDCNSLMYLDVRNIDFTKIEEYGNLTTGINHSIRIVVKDEIQRAWLIDWDSELTNVVLPSEL